MLQSQFLKTQMIRKSGSYYLDEFETELIYKGDQIFIFKKDERIYDRGKICVTDNYFQGACKRLGLTLNHLFPKFYL